MTNATALPADKVLSQTNMTRRAALVSAKARRGWMAGAALCLPLFVAIPLTAHADPLTADQKRMAKMEKELMKLRFEKAHPKPVRQMSAYSPATEPVVVIPKQPYNWTGFFIGGEAGVSTNNRSPRFSVPTYGALQGHDIGFANSGLSNSFNVDSQPYNALANGTNSGATVFNNNYTTNTSTPINTNSVAPGYTSYTATASGSNYTLNGNNTAIGAGPANYVTTNPGNFLPGNRTDSQLSTASQSHRLLGMLGGDLGYRQQFGVFVLGVEADGGYVDGKQTTTSNSTGQFSNAQGAVTGAQVQECYTPNGNGGCGGSGTQTVNGSVTVANNGNSGFSQSVTAGPQWLGTARLSAGIAADRVLFYATGGLAYGEANIATTATYHDTENSSCSGAVPNGTSGNLGGSAATGFTCNGGANGIGSSFTYSDAAQWSGSTDRLKLGFALGSGAAFAVTDNVTLKLEGYYYNLGTVSTTAYGTGSQTLNVNSGAAPAGTTPGTRTASVTPFSVSRQIDGFVAKIGVQLKFDTSPPQQAVVAARY